jgi:hypothetical protein
MPPEQGVWGRDRGNLPQGRTAHAVRSRSQSSAIVVGEARSPGPKLAPQESVLFEQIRDRLTRRWSNQPVSAHSTMCNAAGSITRPSLYHGEAEEDVGRVAEHYGLYLPFHV